MLLDVTADKVPDVRQASTHTQLQLGIKQVIETDKCVKIPVGGSKQIIYQISNPTSETVRTMLFIDSTTGVGLNFPDI